MSLFLHRALPVLMYAIAALLVVHLTWNAFANRRITAWLQLIGFLLLALSIMATSVRPTYKLQSRNAKDGTEVFVPDEPYSTIVQTWEVVGALLIIGGFGTQVAQRVSAGLRDRRTVGRKP